MKFRKILLPLMCAMTLTGCSSLVQNLMPGGNSKSSSESLSTTSSSSNSNQGSSSGSSSVVPTSTQVTSDYPLDRVVQDINSALADYGMSLEWSSQYQEYGIGVSFGSSTDESESNLSGGASQLAGLLPSYMSCSVAVYGDPTDPEYYDLFDDGSYYFYAQFVTPDEGVAAAIVTYIYDSELCGELAVYENVD